MTSAAQTLAHHRNAQKSTGPRRAEGEAVVAQNAGRYGLPAEQVVIQGEDPEEFDSFRDEMWAELAPVGAVETLLAQRAVGLSWRLRRAERLQRTVLEAVYREDAEDLVLWPKCGLPVKPGRGDDELVLAAVVLADLARAKVFDRLLIYERRIENSLYRTMAELQKHQRLREREPAAAPPCRGETSSARTWGDNGARSSDETSGENRGGKCEVSGSKPEAPSRNSGLQTSNLTLQTCPEVSSLKQEGSGHGPGLHSSNLRLPTRPEVSGVACPVTGQESDAARPGTANSEFPTANFTLSTSQRVCERPVSCGMGFQPMNHRQDADATKSHGQDARATLQTPSEIASDDATTNGAAAAEPSCETKPVCPGVAFFR